VSALLPGSGFVALPPPPDDGAGPGPETSGAAPHEIPFDVIVHVLVRPSGDVLRVLVRAPLEAMRDIEFPQAGRSGDNGFLDIEAASPFLRDAAQLWIADYLTFYEGEHELPAPVIAAARASLPSNRSFAEFDTALETARGPPLPAGTQIPWRQVMLDVLLEYEIESDTADFSVRPEFAHLGLQTITLLRFGAPDKAERAFQFFGDPGLVRLDPSWFQAGLRFVEMGLWHILQGLDHLLFLLCLVLPVRRLRELVFVVTSFTVAHSITLGASVLGIAPSGLWFPPLIETLIALSIVYMAVENIVGAGPGRRWVLAFGFGLAHGFGFSFLLRESLQFAGSHLVMALLSFNVGVEIGQLLAVAVAVPVLGWAFRRPNVRRTGVVLVSVVVAHTAWHWMTERWGDFSAYSIDPPTWGAATAASLMRWMLLVLIAGVAVWGLAAAHRAAAGWFGRRDKGTSTPDAGP